MGYWVNSCFMNFCISHGNGVGEGVGEERL